MSTLKWFRMHNDVVDNDKVRLLAFEDRWHYVALLALKSSGLLDGAGAHLERRIAVKLGLSVAALDEVKRRLTEVELIDESWQPVGWEKHQYISDSSAERTRKYRERKVERHGDVTVTPSETETETETDSKAEPEKTKKPVPGLDSVDGLDQSAFETWLAYRRQIKKPFASPQTILAQAKKLAGFKGSQMAVVQQSIDNGWQGLFAIKITTASARRQSDARVWDPDREQYVDASTLKPWQLERITRANEEQAAFETGAVNA